MSTSSASFSVSSIRVPVGCAHPELKPPRVHLGEDLQAQASSDADDDDRGQSQIGRHDHPPPADDTRESPAVGVDRPLEQGSPTCSVGQGMVAEEPGREHRHERARQQVGGDHREADRKRQRDEQRLRRPLHEERRQEHREDAKHRQEPRDRRVQVPLTHGRGDRAGPFHLVVDVLDLDGRLVDQDADGQRQAAEGHEVDRLAREPQGHQRPADRERDVEDHDDDAPPVAEEDQHHQSGQDRAEDALGRQAPHGVGDGGGLVELEADLDVVGEDRLHLGQGFLDVPDDRKGGGVGPLGHEDVDGPAAVDQCITGGDVGGVLHGGHVADVDRGVRADTDGDGLQLLDVADQRVDRHDRHHLADADIARGADRVAIRQGRDQFVGRDGVRPQPLGIGPDDHRALVAAEGGRRRDARQAREHRPDLEERLVLDLADRLGLAREHKVADGDAAGVEPGDERRNRPRGHEGARHG